ncbi:hypothetical protein MSG28_005415 [Choristoneura fumiferana]|uniref:Uncharacterized protein n=1 Tax=Choristoneura fumiferana TaxID=7141 RepID=A0ACC0JR38_CHOFU|nr:hypothetical protein MSG28_005415 [Choristoneura fumiferana]
MQETVTTAPEHKSLLSSFLDVLEAQNKTATAERQLQEERYRRRAQRIYDYHVTILVMLEIHSYFNLLQITKIAVTNQFIVSGARWWSCGAAWTTCRSTRTCWRACCGGRGAARGARGAGEDVPLSAGLVRQAAALQRCMAQCVANAAQIRALLAATHQPQMDQMLAKMCFLTAQVTALSAYF